MNLWESLAPRTSPTYDISATVDENPRQYPSTD
jgi:hypothetical protein